MAGRCHVHYRADVLNGGAYRITGTVTELGVVGRYPVVLFHRKTYLPLKKVYSDPASGAYAFNYIGYAANGYFVIAFDYGSNPLNAAIADLVTPELMP